MKFVLGAVNEEARRQKSQQTSGKQNNIQNNMARTM